MKHILYRLTLALLVGGCLILPAWAGVTASLDRLQVAMGERVRLQVQNDGTTDGQPNIGPLTQDFDIVGSSQGSSTRIVNGRISSQKQFTILLAPKRAGTIRIAPIQWGAEQSGELVLTVGASADASQADPQAAGGAAAPVTLSATLDQKTPYVQSAVVLTLRLYVGVQLTQASLDLPGSSDVLVKQMGEDKQSTESRNGRSYQLIERKYALIPQRSGKLSLKGPLLQAQVLDMGGNDGSDMDALFGQSPLSRFMRSTRPLNLSASPIEINVLPRPDAAASGTTWLPAQQVTLEESWRPDGGTLRVGEPLTRHLHLSALGVTGAQLPDLSTLMGVPDGIKLYPDQAKTDESLSNGTLQGTRDQDVVLIASAPGRYELPALHLTWWDTVSKVQRQADLPARSVEILPALAGSGGAGAVLGAVTPTPPGLLPSRITLGAGNGSSAVVLADSALAHPQLWQWVSAAMLLLWAGTLVAWWRARRRGAPSPSATVLGAQGLPVRTQVQPSPPKAKAALASLQRACRDNDPKAARQHLLAWAAAFWPQSPPHGLNAIAKRLDPARFSEALQQLDRACYTDATWQGDTLAHAFAEPPTPQPVPREKSLLPDLYE
jgi:hypothetical protein